MSYETSPKWAEKINIMGNQIVCPDCREAPDEEHKAAVMECIYENTTYEVQHVPKQLIFTCMNEECDNCDKDYWFKVELNIILLSMGEHES